MSNKERLPLFITKLVAAKWESGAIKIEFNAGSDEVHTRFLSEPYAKELAFALLQLLSAKDSDPSPPFDDLKFEEGSDGGLRFTLFKGGAIVLTGSVTKSVAQYAHRFLTEFFDGPGIIRPDKWKRKKA